MRALHNIRVAKLLKFLIDPTNRRILVCIGGAIVAMASGGAAVATYIWPPRKPPTTICAQNGSIAAGNDATDNHIQYTITGSTIKRFGNQTCGEPERH